MERADLRRAVLERVRPEWPGATEEEVLAALGRGTHDGGAKGRFFVLDPIDGTKGFLRGDQYAVALGLIEDGQVTAGVLGCPNLAAPDGSRGVLVHAARGRGCRVALVDADGAGGPATRVSQWALPRDIRLCESVESAHSDQSKSRNLRERLKTKAEPVRIDSQAKYALLALGGAELYLRSPTREDRRELIWDHAAGVIVVEEAGGRVTDLAGKPLDFSLGRRLEANRGIVATNGAVHDAVLAAIA